MYDPVPPVPEAVALPVVEQVALLMLVTEGLGPEVPVIPTVTVFEQPPLSVTVTVYVPVVRPVAVCVVWPLLLHR